jgi:hypothetical protein
MESIDYSGFIAPSSEKKEAMTTQKRLMQNPGYRELVKSRICKCMFSTSFLSNHIIIRVFEIPSFQKKRVVVEKNCPICFCYMIFMGSSVNSLSGSGTVDGATTAAPGAD